MELVFVIYTEIKIYILLFFCFEAQNLGNLD